MNDLLSRARFLRPKSSWLNEVLHEIANKMGNKRGEGGEIQYSFQYININNTQEKL